MLKEMTAEEEMTALQEGFKEEVKHGTSDKWCYALRTL